MNLVLLLPLGLAALAAWLVPLLIHLRRRSEQHRTAFAALRSLPARARPRSRLRFEEWPLLLVRLLLLATLALLLAWPVLYGGPHAKRWTVVVPGVARTALPPRREDEEYRWLAPGFPGLEEAQPPSRQPVGSLLRELDAWLPADTRLSVLAPTQLDGADAVRPVLQRAVQWRIVAHEDARMPTPPTNQPAKARPLLAVRHAESASGAVPYLRAASFAWQVAGAAPAAKPGERKAPPGDIAPVDQALPPTDRPLAWLAPGPLPAAVLAWIDKGGTALVTTDADVPDMARRGLPLLRDDEGNVLVRGLPRGRGRLLQWTRPLSPEAMPQLLEPEFPELLWQLFAPQAPEPARIAAADYRPRTGARAWPEIPRDLQPWLLVLVAALFVIERWMASGRRGIAPE
ncbi:BatA domain-containing protein [Lysobacter niabensis]|uniref:BatA domain-containing protein n=1 Tax=Agrilutibacter niabensis TaxID=380628 RepID=UPI00361C2C19